MSSPLLGGRGLRAGSRGASPSCHECTAGAASGARGRGPVLAVQGGIRCVIRQPLSRRVRSACSMNVRVLGPWMNPRWLNIVATVIVGVLLVLSGTLVIDTMFSGLNAAQTSLWLAAALVLGALIAARHPDAARLPGHFRAAADRQSNPDRPGVTKAQFPCLRLEVLADGPVPHGIAAWCPPGRQGLAEFACRGRSC